MTKWNGIKVGGLYKMTGRGSRGAPLLMVTAMELDGSYGLGVTALVGGHQDCFDLFFDKYEQDDVQQVAYDNDNRPSYTKWPYVEVE
jgi:hypothetical protein